MKKLKKNPKLIIIICIAILLITIVTITSVILLTKDKKEDKKVNNKSSKEENPLVEKEPEKEEITIVNPDSNTRPYAVMINNINEARQVQSGLSKAYIVYEILAEGGITRFLALFKDVDVEKLGSIRSARDYYLDYVMENDAIFVHWGWSPQAQEDIPKLGINNLNGLYDGGFYRLPAGTYPAGLAYEHTGFSSTSNIKNAAEKKGYRLTSDAPLLLNYSAQEVDYSNNNPGNASKVVLTYSNYTQVTYVYDEENKVYKRYNLNNQECFDHETNEEVTAKNIIVYQVDCYQIPGDEKGRIVVENEGKGTGFYITGGKSVKINWSKDKRDSQTKYTLTDGTELKVNDGNTFIQILPTSGKVVVS